MYIINEEDGISSSQVLFSRIVWYAGNMYRLSSSLIRHLGIEYTLEVDE